VQRSQAQRLAGGNGAISDPRPWDAPGTFPALPLGRRSAAVNRPPLQSGMKAE